MKIFSFVPSQEWSIRLYTLRLLVVCCKKIFILSSACGQWNRTGCLYCDGYLIKVDLEMVTNCIWHMPPCELNIFLVVSYRVVDHPANSMRKLTKDFGIGCVSRQPLKFSKSYSRFWPFARQVARSMAYAWKKLTGVATPDSSLNICVVYAVAFVVNCIYLHYLPSGWSGIGQWKGRQQQILCSSWTRILHKGKFPSSLLRC